MVKEGGNEGLFESLHACEDRMKGRGRGQPEGAEADGGQV